MSSKASHCQLAKSWLSLNKHPNSGEILPIKDLDLLLSLRWSIIRGPRGGVHPLNDDILQLQRVQPHLDPAWAYFSDDYHWT